jgi:glycosyltransferase involved in cell wall biosynthesis
MRIAQVAHLTESIPPPHYGGTERIVSYLTEELVRLGHDVTLFASGDSTTASRLVPVWPKAMGRIHGIFNRDAVMMVLLERVCGSTHEFDIIHSHLDFIGFPLARRCPMPMLTTIHGRLDLPELAAVYRYFTDLPLISVSDAQRRPIPWANWKATIQHGLPEHLYSFHPKPGRYVAFLGRISPEKSPDTAIGIAKAIQMPLKIAAKVDPADHEYFQHVIKPVLGHPLVEFVGEITDREKDEFLGEASAVLCPFRPEAFGLVLIEALACGTPVVTYNHGSFSEIIEDGVTGFLCSNLSEMIAAVESIPRIDRAQCRRAFETRFTTERMVNEYLRVYDEILKA